MRGEQDPIANEIAYEASRVRVMETLQAGFTPESWDVMATELAARRTESLAHLEPDEQAQKILDRSLEVLSSETLQTRLERSSQTGKPLEIKYGIDPTGADVHLGHAVPMILLDRLQRMGHHVTFVVGNFTAGIGDPSGRVASRPVLTSEKIAENMTTYRTQAAPLFDMDKVRVVHNAEWLEGYPLGKLMGILAKVSVTDSLQRRDFRKRLDEGSGLTQAEMLYPVVMALDSVELQSDIEVGGKDQLLNMQTCRKVMEIVGYEPEVIVTTDILQGTDGGGTKMSKSLGNYIGLTASPDEIYGQLMSIPDDLLEQYFKLTTEIENSEWQRLDELMSTGAANPKLVKELLASDIVQVLHGPEAAGQAREAFNRKFSTHTYNELDDLPEVAISAYQTPLHALADARSESISAVRRLLQGGGVKLIAPDGTETVVKDADTLASGLTNARLIKAGRLILQLSQE